MLYPRCSSTQTKGTPLVGTRKANEWAYDADGRKVDHRLAGMKDGKLLISIDGYCQIALGYLVLEGLTAKQVKKVNACKFNFKDTGMMLATTSRSVGVTHAEPIDKSVADRLRTEYRDKLYEV